MAVQKDMNAMIAAQQKGTTFPALRMVRDNKPLAAMASKLVRNNRQSLYDSAGNRKVEAPNVAQLKERSVAVSRNINDAQTVLQVLPDLQLAGQILISSILSPKDMITTELIYTPAPEIVTSELAAMLIGRIRQHFETDYKIKQLLPDILQDVLIETGSYPIVVIPENSVDDAINGKSSFSMESMGEYFEPNGTPKHIGLLGNPSDEVKEDKYGLSMENFNYSFSSKEAYNPNFVMENTTETFLSITDNFNVLKIPTVTQKLREQRVMKTLGPRSMSAYALESGGIKLNDRQLTGLFFKERAHRHQPVTSLKTQEQLHRHTVGAPLIMRLPSESVIPVYIPGAEDRHIGYFVIIDAAGNPVSRKNSPDFYQEFGQRLNSGGNFPSAMLNKVKSQMTGFDCSDSSHLDYSAKVYGEMIEADLLARLRNGIYGNGVAIAKQDEIYRIMLSRALARQQTQMLWVPIELMTYFAFRYNGDGIGKSLMDDMKILNSLRSMLAFTNVMAALRNSIGRTEVKLKLDEKDPNPQKTIEIMITEIARTRQQAFPVGTQNPVDLVNWLQRAGMEFTFEGHPGLPDVQVDFGEKSSSYVKPDTELADSLKDQSIQAFGLTPEMVDAASSQPEFATSIVSNNVLLAKRVMQYQDKFTPFITDHARKVLMNTEGVMNDLANLLRSNFDLIILTDLLRNRVKDSPEGQEVIIDLILREFLLGLEVELPRPDSVSLENQFSAMETHEKMLDKGLDAYCNQDMFTTATAGQTADQIATIRATLKAYFMRQYMADNGILPELSEILESNDDGKAAVDIYGSQTELMKGLIRSCSKYVAGLFPIKEAADKVMDALGVQADSGFGGGSDFDDGNEDPFAAGGDDFDADMDFPDLDSSAPGEENKQEEKSEQSTTTTSDGQTTTTSSSSSSSSTF